MRVKIRGGTVSHSDGTLCSTCNRSTIIRGRRFDEEIVDCHVIGLGHRRITFPVASCSAYSDARLPSMLQLLENAWVLGSGTKRRTAGFVHGKELQQEELMELMTAHALQEDD